MKKHPVLMMAPGVFLLEWLSISSQQAIGKIKMA